METNITDNRKFISNIGLRYVIGSIIIFAAQIGIVKLAYLIKPDLSDQIAFLIQMMAMYLVAMPILFTLIKQVPKQVTLVKNNLSVGRFLKFFVIGYAAMICSNFIGTGIAGVISSIKNSPVNNSLLSVVSGNSIWLNFFIMVLCAPVIEEFLFRKLLMDRLLKYGEKFAIIMSGLMFGLFHGNLYQFVYAFALGCVFAYVYSKTGQIKYTIMLHMMVNFMGTVAAALLLKYAGATEILEAREKGVEAMSAAVMNNMGGMIALIAFELVVFALVIVGIVLFCINIKKITFLPGLVEIGKGNYFKTAILNIGMGAFVIFWVAYIIYQTVI